MDASALEKPDHLSDDASEMWDRMVAALSDIDVLLPIDVPSLEIACEAYARWKEAVAFRRERGVLAKGGNRGVITAPWVGIEERASAQFRAFASEFGLTPLARGAIAGGEMKTPKLKHGWAPPK